MSWKIRICILYRNEWFMMVELAVGCMCLKVILLHYGYATSYIFSKNNTICISVHCCWTQQHSILSRPWQSIQLYRITNSVISYCALRLFTVFLNWWWLCLIWFFFMPILALQPIPMTISISISNSPHFSIHLDWTLCMICAAREWIWDPCYLKQLNFIHFNKHENESNP